MMDLVDGTAGAAQVAMHGLGLGEVLHNEVVDLSDFLVGSSLPKEFAEQPEQRSDGNGRNDDRWVIFHATCSLGVAASCWSTRRTVAVEMR